MRNRSDLWTDGVVTHFSFHPSMIASASAGVDAFLQDFIEHRLMEPLFVLRGK